MLYLSRPSIKTQEPNKVVASTDTQIHMVTA